MSSSVSVTVAEVATEADFDALVDVEDQAYGVSKMITLLFGSYLPSQREDTLRLRKARHLHARRNDPACTYLQAVTGRGETVGMAVWYFYTEPTYSRDPWPAEAPPGANEDLYAEYFGALVKAREKRFGCDRPYVLMANLVVSPRWQRMGIGKALLEWGVHRADELRLERWIDASPHGIGLYRRFGWQEVETLEFGLAKGGGAAGDVHRTVCMVRAPTVRKDGLET